jgi:hypothetical protein
MTVDLSESGKKRTATGGRARFLDVETIMDDRCGPAEESVSPSRIESRHRVFSLVAPTLSFHFSYPLICC